MRNRIELPDGLRGRAFTLAHGGAHGVGRGRLRGSDLAIPHRGARVPADADEFSGACAALALIMGADSAFSHLTAARLWGIPLPASAHASTTVHVSTRLPGTRIRRANVRGHTISSSAAFASRRGLAVTAPLRTWLDLEPLLGDDDLVAAADHLVLSPRYPVGGDPRPYLPREQLILGSERHSGRGARRIRRLVELVRDGAESRRETLLRLALARHGLPEPALNEEIVDARGRFIGRVDLLYPDWRVIVEYDGDHHRTSVRQFDRDAIRREDLIAAGYRYLSVRAPSASLAPARTEAALRAAGWTPFDESVRHVPALTKVPK